MKKYKVRRVCAWCKLEMGMVEFDWEPPGGITHGICDECKRVELDKIKKEEGI